MMGQKSGKIINISSPTAYCSGVLAFESFTVRIRSSKEAGKVRWYRPAGFADLIITSYAWLARLTPRRDGNDVIYTADSESSERTHRGWLTGIRIGSLNDGKVTIFIPPHTAPNLTDGAMGERIAIDADGNIYTAEAQLRGITKYVRN